MTPTNIPRLEEFLAAPVEEIAKVAPQTVIYAAGGTRRAAALANIEPASDDYPRWSRSRLINCISLFFQHGARHLFSTAIWPRQLEEVGRYRERLMAWTDWGLAGPETLADYARLGWRVRLVGIEDLPELQPAAQRLYEVTPRQWDHTLWWFVSPSRGAHWEAVLAAARQSRAYTQQDVIRALYGEDVPPASLYLGFGKPMLAPDAVPICMAGEMQFYWSQRPGYSIDEITLRHILYDYAYLRSTWTEDKNARYNNMKAQRTLWEQPVTLGLGRRVEGFWYPATLPAVSQPTEEIYDPTSCPDHIISDGCRQQRDHFSPDRSQK